jgi:hypothetical protein
VKRRQFMHTIIGVVLLPSAAVYANETNLVLVASSGSILPSIKANDVRKAFLGIPVSVNEKTIVPIVNSSNNDTKELFLQRVLFMSGAVYERHSVGRVFRNGGNKLAEFSDPIALASALNANPLSISFMLAADAKKMTTVKILCEL